MRRLFGGVIFKILFLPKSISISLFYTRAYIYIHIFSLAYKSLVMLGLLYRGSLVHMIITRISIDL